MLSQNRQKPAKIRPNERVYVFCVSFPICRQKHKIDGKTTAYRTNPLKIKKQTCSRPLLAHVAGLLFCAYTLHLHAMSFRWNVLNPHDKTIYTYPLFSEWGERYSFSPFLKTFDRVGKSDPRH